MATVGFTRSIELFNNSIIANNCILSQAHNDGLDHSLSSPLPPSADGEAKDMNLRTEAALKRQLAHLLLQILSVQLTGEAPLMRQRRLCKMLTALVLADIMHTVDVNKIHRTLTETRSQHPALLKIAQDLDEFIQNQKEDLMVYVMGDLKHPERSKLDIPQDLVEMLMKRRAEGEQSADTAQTPATPKPKATAKKGAGK